MRGKTHLEAARARYEVQIVWSQHLCTDGAQLAFLLV